LSEPTPWPLAAPPPLPPPPPPPPPPAPATAPPAGTGVFQAPPGAEAPPAGSAGGVRLDKTDAPDLLAPPPPPPPPPPPGPFGPPRASVGHGLTYGQPVWGPAPGRPDPMAIWAFSLSLVGLLCFGVLLEPIAAVLGWVSLARIARSEGRIGGRGFAVAGAVVGTIGTPISIWLYFYVQENGGFAPF
jgi:hypothetical protein